MAKLPRDETTRPVFVVEATEGNHKVITSESKRLVIGRREGERVVLTPAKADGRDRESSGDPQPATRVNYRVELCFLQIEKAACTVIELNTENCRRLDDGQGGLHLLTPANEHIVITIQGRRGSAASVRIEAPASVRVRRGELLDDGSKECREAG